ncbi:hypothetical protein ACLBWT_18600 [Paenibacillus sp. D51F]
MELTKAWKITEFSKLVDKHHNTIDQWFKALEDKRIHYVNRILGEKIYDETDLEIARYIKEGREKSYNLQIIFEQLPSVYEVRPFPDDWSTSSDSLVDYESIRRKMEQRFEEKIEAAKSVLFEEVMIATARVIEEQQKLLPPVKTIEEQQTERVNDIMTRLRIERKLEDLAIHAWGELPDTDRLRKVGLFRKDEDWGKRDAFIRRYVQEHIEDALKEEYGLK